MKRKRVFYFIIIFFVGLLLFWAVWETFSVCIVPQTRVKFRSFEAFRDKTANSGLSMSLPDSQENLKYFYQYDKKEVQYVQEDVLAKNGITFLKYLLLEGEKIEDFYYVVVRRTEGTHEYYTCVLANDTNNRIMEVSYRNTNPQ